MNRDSRNHGSAFSFVFAANDASEHFRLVVVESWIVRERDPKGHPDAVMLLTGEQEAATRGVTRFAFFRFLAERRNPTKPYREAKTHTRVSSVGHG